MTGDIHVFFVLEMGSLMTSSSSAGPIQISKFPEPCFEPIAASVNILLYMMDNIALRTGALNLLADIY